MTRTFYLQVLFAALLLAGCEHKELSDGKPHMARVKVAFDWQHAPEAAPGSMCVYFFPQGGGKSLRYDFTDLKGGVIDLPAGSYDALCLNSDSEKILFRNTDKRETFEIYTQETTLLSPLGLSAAEGPQPEEPVVAIPEMIWSSTADNLAFTKDQAEYSVTFFPAEALSSYTFEIRNVENAERAGSMSASLEGMAGSMLLASRQPSGVRSTLPFEARLDKAKSTVTGSFLSFGHCPQSGDGHRFTVYVVLNDGSKWYYRYDATQVAEQIHSAKDPRHVHIVLNALKLPDMIGGDGNGNGGFTPDVNGWQDVEVPLDVM